MACIIGPPLSLHLLYSSLLTHWPFCFVSPVLELLLVPLPGMIISEISGHISPVQWAHQIMLMYPPATTVSFWHVSSTSRAALELCGLGITDGSGRKEGAESTDSSWVLEDQHLPISKRSYWVDKPLITEGGVLFFLILSTQRGQFFWCNDIMRVGTYYQTFSYLVCLFVCSFFTYLSPTFIH